MPWDVIQRKGKWVVVDKSGHVYGTHPSKKKAREQQKALYASEGRKSKG
jgi:hypothetical protein